MLAAVGCGATGRAEKGKAVQLLTFINSVARLDPLDHASFGTVVAQAPPVAEANAYFATYRYRDFAIGDGLTASAVELREPKPGSGATGGALLVMKVGGACVRVDTLKQHFGELRVFQVPRARNPEETLVYAVRSGAREVRFAFPGDAPECLSGLVVETFPS